MPWYVLRLVSLDNGRIRYRYQIEATDDAEAIRRSEDKRTLAPMELWLGGRLVKRWHSFPPR